MYTIRNERLNEVIVRASAYLMYTVGEGYLCLVEPFVEEDGTITDKWRISAIHKDENEIVSADPWDYLTETIVKTINACADGYTRFQLKPGYKYDEDARELIEPPVGHDVEVHIDMPELVHLPEAVDPFVKSINGMTRKGEASKRECPDNEETTPEPEEPAASDEEEKPEDAAEKTADDIFNERIDEICDTYAEECQKIHDNCQKTCDEWVSDYKENYQKAVEKESFWTGFIGGTVFGATTAFLVTKLLKK